MKTFILLILLCFLGLTVNAQTIKIMPLGNSITQADNSHYSYRYNLWSKLNSSGLDVSFDFVGSMNTNFNGSPAYPNPGFDRDHEGHWGWFADQLLGGLPGWLANYTPDIVLLHAGSNDAFNFHSTSSTVAELEQIIDVLRADNSNVTILLARLIPVNNPPLNTNINALNAEMDGIVSRKNSAASRVILVDQNTGFNAATDTYDGVHPNSSGEEKMAQKWFDAILALQLANRPPAVANAIVDQNSSAGTSFNFTFPANTFTDPDAGTTLTYAAALENGSPLPGWLGFTGSTRTFSGMPAAANVGLLSIRVTASDGRGGSVSDVFALTVNPATKVTPLITWANPATILAGTALSSVQLNATAAHNGTPVAGTFTYTPPLGTVLGVGAGQQLSVSFTPTNGTLYNAASKTVAIDVNSSASTTAFYRALNLNGPALSIDGNNWTASAGAANFSFTNGLGFTNQSVALVPSTDATRASMIRSSIYGKTVSFAVGGVPAGSYQVWLYAWEDNFVQTYSISIEGAVVEANVNSGNAGSWKKLGPYPVTLSDGVINISSSGGDANFSGIEIWTAGSPPANRPPVVANAIVDQNSSAGTPFNFTFPVNTFADPDAGTTLTYAAALENGSPLPGWLGFTGSTRTFNGTPATANVGSFNIRVTASDGGGGSVSDVFTLTVNPATKLTPLINWANPATILAGTALSSIQLNATASHNGTPVAGTFTYTPPLGTVLGVGTGQQLSVSFVPTDGTLYNPVSKTVTINVNSSTPTPGFYRALNLNGPALSIDGNNWTASAGAANFSFTNGLGFTNQSVALVPSTDATRASMIRSSIYGKTVSFAVSGVPAGSYQVWLYAWEDNFVQTYSISLEGTVVEANINSGNAGSWKKLGPYPVTISDGVINISSSGGDANFSGIEIWTAGAPPANRPPVVANAIVDQNSSAGTPFNFTFPANTFTDPDAGTTLTYNAALENGSPLPGWLGFTGSTRTFNGTPATANVGSLNIRVTASDGGGGSVSDIFTLTVNPATKVTPLIAWANPAPIVSGTALSSAQLNATTAHNGTPVAGTFTYTPPLGTVLGVGAGQQLSVSFTPTNGTLYNAASKTVTIDVNSSAPTTAFYRALNLNGPALNIDGNNWTASAGAPNFSFTNGFGFTNQSVSLVPSTDATRASMIRSSIYGKTVSFAVSGVPAGSYQVWLYVWEDNFVQTYSISIEGGVVEANANSGNAGSWKKLGPYPVTLSDGVINISSSGGDANFSGIEIWQENQSQSANARLSHTETIQYKEAEQTQGVDLGVYPNPFLNSLNIVFPEIQSGEMRLELFDVHGKSVRLLFEGTALPGAERVYHLEPDLAEGVYIIQLINGKRIIRSKLVKGTR